VGWLLLPYCLAGWTAVGYLGEHYVADVIVGVIYASVAYAVVQILVVRRASKEQKRVTRAGGVGRVSDSLTA